MSLTRSVKILALSIIANYTLQAPFDTHVRISQHDRSGQIVTGIFIWLMIKLILVDIDINNANITLEIWTHVV